MGLGKLGTKVRLHGWSGRAGTFTAGSGDMDCPRCGTEIREHEATGCLDAWVAEAVMGWPEWTGDDDYSGPYPMWRDWGTGVAVYDNELLGSIGFMFLPGTDIAAAWRVVEKTNHDNNFVLTWYNPDGRQAYVDAQFGFGIRVGARASSAPLAICRAAILARQ